MQMLGLQKNSSIILTQQSVLRKGELRRNTVLEYVPAPNWLKLPATSTTLHVTSETKSRNVLCIFTILDAEFNCD